MSSKSGKSDSKNRDSLPRSASTMSDDSKESGMSMASSATSKSSTVISSSSKSSSSTYANGVALEDWVMPGFLNLKELNALLQKYIGQVQGLDLNQTKSGSSSSVTVNIDRSEIIDLQSKYDDQLEDWKKKSDDKDEEIAKLKAEISKLKAEIKRLKESNNSKDGTIKERDLTIEGLKAEINRLTAMLSMFKNQKEIYGLQIKHLQGEITKLTGELNAMIIAFSEEQNRSQDLAYRLVSMEKELRFKMDVLGSELASERGKTNIDIASLDSRIQGRYDNRLEGELITLREIYEKHMIVSKETLEMSYKKKVEDLQTSLDVQKKSVKPTEDMTELKIELEKYKKKIEELDSNNRDLSMQWSKLSVELREKEFSFQAKMSAKETEVAYLAKQTAEYKKMCDDMRIKLQSEATEVKVYNRLITPEMNRINRYTEQFSNGTEESSQTIKVSQMMSKTSSAQKVTKGAAMSTSASIAK